jgi:hypothetical protein
MSVSRKNNAAANSLRGDVAEVCVNSSPAGYSAGWTGRCPFGSTGAVPVHNSSRTMFISRGASIPSRTVFGPMRTIVIVTLSPTRIFSPGFRDSTNIPHSPFQWSKLP